MHKVFVTGSTSGLGRAIAEKFLSEGKTVYFHGRDPSQIGRLLKQSNCAFFPHDLLDLRRTGEVVDFVRKEKIDCFVNNAGIYSNKGTFISPQTCVDIVTTNLLAPILILNEVYNYYKKQRRGTIISINSIAGIAPNFDEASYCASKYGIKGFIKSLQLDAYKHNVRIMEYYLGAVQTRMTHDRPGFTGFMKPVEIAKAIYDNVTGKNTFVALRQEWRAMCTL